MEGLKTFIGVKMIQAKPMSRREFLMTVVQGQNDEQQACKDEDGYLVVYPDGYRTWSPKDVFEKVYKQIDCQWAKTGITDIE